MFLALSIMCPVVQDVSATHRLIVSCTKIALYHKHFKPHILFSKVYIYLIIARLSTVKYCIVLLFCLLL